MILKQFVKFRVERNHNICNQQYIVSNTEQYFLTVDQLNEMQHRRNNFLLEPLVMIEAQVGEYLGEDDIIRMSDDF